MSETKKTVEIRISVSTDFRTEGRYFLDLRDTTNGANRQMMVRKADREDILVLIGQIEGHAARNAVTVTILDETKELGV